MSGEDMEISTDLGHHGFDEDINIDFEFAASQDDQDLELGDYNQAEEFQHFNSDNRDELMAENDDASYGMADAEDVSYNEDPATANGYEVVIGDTDVYSWPENDVATDQEGAIQSEQVQDLVNIDGDAIDFGGSAAVSIVEPSPKTQSPALATEVRHGSEKLTGGEPEAKDDLDAIATQDFSNAAEEAFDNPGAENATTYDDEPKRGYSELLQSANDAKPQDANAENEDLATAESEQPGLADSETTPLPVDDDIGNNHDGDEDEIGYEQFEDGGAEEAAEINETLNTEPSGPISTNDKQDAEADEALAGGDTDFTAGEYQLDHDSYELVEPYMGQEVDAAEARATALASNDRTGSEKDANETLERRDDDDSENGINDMAAIAGRHAIVVHYGETDYQLFADNPDDDPSSFFFKDLSALELPLGEFLSGIRNVIAEEVSPLDELVLHVDGLGLEFAESMTSQILEGYTFGHILSLYDSLIENDAGEGTIEAPEVYMYLMVRPNCLQRLKALQDQAASGRSFADVAVYREASPVEEAHHSADSLGLRAISPDFAEEELYDDDGDSEAEYISQEHTDDASGEAQTADLEDHQLQRDDDHAEEKEDVAGDDVEDAVDYDNLDLTPSQQGNSPHFMSSPIPTSCLGAVDCGCDTCWIRRVEEDTVPHLSTDHHRSAILPLHRSTSSDSTSSQKAINKTGGVTTALRFNYEPSVANKPPCQDPANRTNSGDTFQTDENLISLNHTASKANLATEVHEQHDAAESESTSATATLDGEPNDGEQNDEIDYDENDLDVSNDHVETEGDAPVSIPKSIPPVDEEITWESDNEEARQEQPVVNKSSEQVSTTPGKRTRSGSDATAFAAGRKDVKRQRS